VGMCMVFMGILLHLIESFIKYKMNSLNTERINQV
jgi:hypothetical protein